MNTRTVDKFLERHRQIGIDTCVFIYWGEGNETYGPLVAPVFAWLEGHGRAVTSTISMLELLVQPYRLKDVDRVNQLYAVFSTYPHLDWIEPTLQVADCAAQLRGELNLKTAEALQAATALVSQATGFISNDPAFNRVTDLDVLILDSVGQRRK